MAENVLEITDDNFEDAVLNSDTPIVVDFWAECAHPKNTLKDKILSAL